jgi:hypothetical protein
MKEPSRSYSNKPRRRAYRHILAGLRYHRGEKLSFITIGFKRGSIVDVRTVLHQLSTWVKRDKDFKIEFYRVTVWDNDSDDKLWRVHTHIIWNAPFIKQKRILEKVQKYVGESGSVHITLLDGNDKKAARYLMQYLGNQDGFVRFSKSRGWLPKGYERVWKEIKRDFFEPVPLGVRKPLQDSDALFRLMTQSSDDWKREALIENMNAWLDEQRDNPRHCETIPTRLFVQYQLSFS